MICIENALVQARLTNLGTLWLRGTLAVGDITISLRQIRFKKGSKVKLILLDQNDKVIYYKHWNGLLQRFEKMFGLDKEFRFIVGGADLELDYFGGNQVSLVVNDGIRIPSAS